MSGMKSKFGREIGLFALGVMLLGGLMWANQRDEGGLSGQKTEVEVLEAAMFPPWLWDSFEIHMRNRSREFWVPIAGHGARRLRLLDGNGREVILLTKYDPIRRVDIYFYYPEDNSGINPRLPRNERIVSVLTHGGVPKGGWNSVKRPLWIEGEVSDGKCLPTPFKVRVEERGGDRRDFGVR